MIEYSHGRKSCHQHATSSRLALAAYLETERTRIHKRRLVRRWTPVLLQQFDIPPYESALVYWLTDTHCATNADAVAAWLHAQLKDREFADITNAALRLPSLIEDLAGLLRDAMEMSP